MVKIVEIKKCLECPYQSGVDECGHPPFIPGVVDRIPDLDTIPDWCPLPDAPKDGVEGEGGR